MLIDDLRRAKPGRISYKDVNYFSLTGANPALVIFQGLDMEIDMVSIIDVWSARDTWPNTEYTPLEVHVISFESYSSSMSSGTPFQLDDSTRCSGEFGKLGADIHCGMFGAAIIVKMQDWAIYGSSGATLQFLELAIYPKQAICEYT